MCASAKFWCESKPKIGAAVLFPSSNTLRFILMQRAAKKSATQIWRQWPLQKADC